MLQENIENTFQRFTQKPLGSFNEIYSTKIDVVQIEETLSF